MNRITDTLIGASGIGAVELVQTAQIPDLSNGSAIVSTVIQIIIGIVTLLGLIRKKQV